MIAECAVTNTNYLLLTNKVLYIKTKHKTWGESTKIVPLSKIDSIDANFQRLLFPLIIGGIVAPLALVAALLSVIHFWIGMAMTISGLFLIYYGWAGAYQLKINAFQNQQLSYFVDFKTQKLENFIQETQRLLSLREALNHSPSPIS
jgi:ABC-type transport system involved in cytochrome bd biosynthesis fused ATPase/permease subunit